MEAARLVGSGVASDVRRRVPFYVDDWTSIGRNKLRVAAAATFIFFASVMPALAFGIQFQSETEDVINVVHVLAACAITGTLQSVVGGQPLLIVGVAEPIVLVYKYMFDFAKDKDGLGPTMFLAWSAWVCIFTAAFLLVLSLTNACVYINRFTRYAGEAFGTWFDPRPESHAGTLLDRSADRPADRSVDRNFDGRFVSFRCMHVCFTRSNAGPRRSLEEHVSLAPGALIALLFLQQAIKGLVEEFDVSTDNGLWSLFLAFGMLISSMIVRTAREWRFGFGWVRALLADYGVPLLVVAWTGVSYASPCNRVNTPNTWQVTESWKVAATLGDVPGKFVGAAIVPAIIITVLFFFDHNVSSQLAQVPEFNLVKGSAYHWYCVGLDTTI